MASLEIKVNSENLNNGNSNKTGMERYLENLQKGMDLQKTIETPIKKLKELEIDTKGTYLENLKLGKSRKTTEDIVQQLSAAFGKINQTGKMPNLIPYSGMTVNVAPPAPPTNPPAPPSPPSNNGSGGNYGGGNNGGGNNGGGGGNNYGGGGNQGNNRGRGPVPPSPPITPPPVQPPPPPITPPPVQPPPPPGPPGGGGGNNNPISPYADALSRANLATNVLQIFLDLRNAIYIPIREAFITMAKSTTKEGVKASELMNIWGSGIQKSVTSLSTGMGTVAGAAVGSVALPGIGTLAGAALGSQYGGQIGRMAGEMTGISQAAEIVSLLFQIAENTSKNVMAFSPELIGVKLDHQLKTLQMNMNIADKYGSELAEIQESANEIQREIYEVAVDVLITFKPILEAILAAIKVTIVVAQNSGAVVKSLGDLIGNMAIGLAGVSPMLSLVLKDLGTAINKWLNTGKKSSKRVKFDPDQALMSNRPAGLDPATQGYVGKP